jgi:hypothetical protein
MGIANNRELYRAVSEVLEEHRGNDRSLGEFLRSLRVAVAVHENAETIPTAAFVESIREAFAAPIPPLDVRWREHDLSIDPDAPVTADLVDRVLRSQILDMQDADSDETTSHELRYFGRKVARSGSGVRATGGYWVNWDPHAFVECGIQGSFGAGRRKLAGTAARFW